MVIQHEPDRMSLIRREKYVALLQNLNVDYYSQRCHLWRHRYFINIIMCCHFHLTNTVGYIGGSILTLLLDFPNLYISVLVRSAVKAQKLRALNLGINVLEGSPTSDAKIVEALLLDADLVIDAVSTRAFFKS